MEIQLPHKFEPRPYQIPFLRAMDEGKLRAVQVWHRKSGKEKTDWNMSIKKTQLRVGNYWYIFPKLTQARKVIWEGIDQDGIKFLDHIPPEMLDGEPNSTTMLVRFTNSSTLQLIGGDSFDTSIGGNPVGVVFSEYSITNPNVWSYLRPILANNGGWVVFNFTPRGENHAYDLFKLAKADPAQWFCEVLTVGDTKAIPQSILDTERAEIIKLHGTDSFFQQEYYCNFSVPIIGAYYSAQIMRAYEQKRVCHVPYESRLPVYTYWDLGVDDTTVIWFAQKVGGEIRLIDYHEEREKGLPHYAKILKEKPYVYAAHVGPHDIKVRELGSGLSRIETARNLGIEFTVAPGPQEISQEDGIDAVRAMLERCWFDEEKCKDGINALKNYRKIWDDEKKCYQDKPYHDWSSNGADALRTMAVSVDLNIGGPTKNKEWHHPAIEAQMRQNKINNPYQGRALPESQWRKLQGAGR